MKLNFTGDYYIKAQISGNSAAERLSVLQAAFVFAQYWNAAGRDFPGRSPRAASIPANRPVTLESELVGNFKTTLTAF